MSRVGYCYQLPQTWDQGIVYIRVNCSKRITFRDLFSLVDETVVLEAQGAQIRIFKQLNPTP